VCIASWLPRGLPEASVRGGVLQEQSKPSKKVLVVDDESQTRRLLVQILEGAGYACLAVKGASQARQCLEAQHFDLLLCDVRMPGESGIDLIRHVAAVYRDTAIVMLTAVDDRETSRTALDIGVYGYIIKPFRKAQILISIETALRRADLEKESRAYRRELERTVSERTAELRDVNAALKVLLRAKEADKTDMAQKVVANVKQTVMPFLEKLKESPLKPEQRAFLRILEQNLDDIVSPMVKTLSSSYLNLTPAEIQIANLIRQGKRTKEIAALLNLSENTVVSHRFKIRSKLGLKNRRINLASYLKSLQ